MWIALTLLFVLAGCSDSRSVLDELPNSSIAGAARENISESRMDAPIVRGVTIGEDGSRMDACGGVGMVMRGALPLRAAPFDDARTVGSLSEGARMYVCTRSLDQRWLGVVVPAPGSDAAPIDCGVTSPVDRKRLYDGPCQSGWVSNARVRLIAG